MTITYSSTIDDDRVLLTWDSFTRIYVPFLLAYETSAFLVSTNKSRFVRLVFLPLVLWSAYRVATSLKLGWKNDPRFDYWNHISMLVVATITSRVIGWSFSTDDYHRTNLEQYPLSVRTTLSRSIELSLNARGIGWNWRKGVPIPAFASSPSSYTRNLLPTSIFQTVMFDLTHSAAKFLLPLRSSGSIFDPSLPFVQRCLLAYLISFLLGAMIYLFIDTAYRFLTLIAILFFKKSPSSWPPLFDSPWLSTSLADFWGRRWHQIFRHIFLTLGGRPLSLVFGRVGIVMGSFFISGVVHALGIWGMGRGSEFIPVCGFFLMMGVGILGERWWYTISGYRVRGWIGRVWAFSWIIGWSTLMFDVWGRKGMIDSVFLPLWLRVTSIISWKWVSYNPLIIT